MNGTSDPIVIRPHAQDGAEVTHFRISNITNGSLTLVNGTVIHEGDYITVAQGQDGVRFSPPAESMDPGSFQVEASEDGVSVAQQSDAVTAAIAVTPPPSSDPAVDPGVGEEPPAEPAIEPDAEAAEEIADEATTEPAVPGIEETVLPPPVTAEPASGPNNTRPSTARMPFLIKAANQFSRMIQADTVVTAMVQRESNTDRSLRVDKADDPAPERVDRIVRTHNRMSAQVYLNMVNALDDMKQEVSNETTMKQTVVGSAIAVSTGLSVGYVVWLLRGGMLLSSLLSSIPAWQILDPLPVLAGVRDDQESDDDESLASILEGEREKGAKRGKNADRPAEAAERDGRS